MILYARICFRRAHAGSQGTVNAGMMAKAGPLMHHSEAHLCMALAMLPGRAHLDEAAARSACCSRL